MQSWLPQTVRHRVTALLTVILIALVAATTIDVLLRTAAPARDAARYGAIVTALLLLALSATAALAAYIALYVSPAATAILRAQQAIADGQPTEQIPKGFRHDEFARASCALQSAAIRLADAEARTEACATALERQEAAIHAKAEAERSQAEAHDAFLAKFTIALQNLSNGDLKSRLETPFAASFEPLRHAFNRTADKLQVAVFSIGGHAGEIGSATDRILNVADELLRHTEEQASSLEETSASMEQMAATVRQNAGNAREASVAAAATRELASTSGQVALRAITAMEKIERSSRQVGEIVVLIEEIAFQTNILALNAAVEAARAGEAGKGFAVVANEVRALSQRSSQALKDIKALIDSSTSNVAEGSELVRHAGRSLTEISGSVKRVADLIAEIASASQEQAAGVDQVSRAVSNMDAMTQQNAALVQETTAALQTTQSQIRELWDSIGNFDTGLAYVNRPPAPIHPASLTSRSRQTEWRGTAAQKHKPRGAIKMKPGSSAALDTEWQEF